jgi:hypothetical protein
VIAEFVPPAAAPAAVDPREAVKVAVTALRAGGWQVTATLGGRLVALRRSDDWHRVERIREEFARRAWPLSAAAR